MAERNPDLEKCFSRGPQSELERQLIEEYLFSVGRQLSDLAGLPKEEAQKLMREACRYADLKLAEMEALSRFRKEIRAPS